MNRTLPYPPPWQDAPTLCAHLCISEGTIDNWVRLGILPAARMVGGKRMWKWSEVDRLLAGGSSIVPQDVEERMRHAVHEA
jgi:hypothetical protein